MCTLPPGTKPIHAGKHSWGINFYANTCGACIRTRANTGKYFRGGISRVLCQTLRGIHSVRIHAAPVFAPARIQENIPGELFMYWFRARGYTPPPMKSVHSLHIRHKSGESNRPLTPILLKSVAIHLPFLSRCFCKKVCPPLGRK